VSAFKAYDIRGVWGRDFDGETVYRIGRYLPGLLHAGEVLVGRDCRVSSPELFERLAAGITDAGADVISAGLCTTPMVYFLTASRGFGASVQITASHNSRDYNGLKISRTGAFPVGLESGLGELENLVRHDPGNPSPGRGRVREMKGALQDYRAFLGAFLGDTSGLDLGIDCSNGMASLIARDLFGESPEYLFDTLDGTFPNHEPNPLVEENVSQLKRLVAGKGLDLGVIFDGDADRVMFVDDRGRFVRPDIITAVLGLHFLEEEKGVVLHDIRTSRAVIDFVKNLGGQPFMWKVGHSFAKEKMRELHAVYGGELAGHYYFREFFNCDSGMLAAIHVLNIASRLKRQGGRFSDLVASIDTLANSGERNFRIEDKQGMMDRLVDWFTREEEPAAFYDFDGYRVEFAGWWFNVRPSNTEPYLRLVVEAADAAMLEEKLCVILRLMEAPPAP
jgi:phosphomannomutase